MKGINFEDAWKNKVRAKFGDTFAYFASLDDLIKMKRAAGRPKDREDLKYLKKLKLKLKTPHLTRSEFDGIFIKNKLDL